ncbi:MAG: EamA family transporter RarD [Methylocystaceae bacterium]
MRTKSVNHELQGAAFVAASYVLWGLLPIYWKFLKQVPAGEVLCHRIIWCVAFMLLLILFTGQLAHFRDDVKGILTQPRKIIGIIFSAVFLNMNWGIYIWAVNNNHVIDTSLGYYINPLVSVLLGILVLKEKLSRWQGIAFVLALLGVLNLTLHSGTFPWIAVLLAVTFGFYGLLKKTVGVGAVTGLTLETLIMFLPAISYVAFIQQAGRGALTLAEPVTAALLIGAGAVTGIPLLLFASGTIRISLIIVGFLQYISPTLALILGIYLYHEPFTSTHLLSFILIWTGLLVFTISQSGTMMHRRERINQNN